MRDVRPPRSACAWRSTGWSSAWPRSPPSGPLVAVLAATTFGGLALSDFAAASAFQGSPRPAHTVAHAVHTHRTPHHRHRSHRTSRESAEAIARYRSQRADAIVPRTRCRRKRIARYRSERARRLSATDCPVPNHLVPYGHDHEFRPHSRSRGRPQPDPAPRLDHLRRRDARRRHVDPRHDDRQRRAGRSASDLHSSLSQIQWVVTGYMLSLAAVIPVSGWAARRFGAKRVFLDLPDPVHDRLGAVRPRDVRARRSSCSACCRASAAA